MAFAEKLGNFLYDASFTLCFLLSALMVAGSCVSIVLQARLADRGVADWNVLIVVCSYLALGIIAIVIFLSRRHTGLKRLKTIPKPYVPIKYGDIPKTVADLINEEYTRACIAAALARPQTGCHPGWGAPDGKYPNVRFRIAILDTIAPLDALARQFLSELPPLRPHRPVLEHFKKLDFILLQDDPMRLRDYNDLVEQARFDVEEPTEQDWERCEEIVDQMRSILNFYLAAGTGDRAGAGRTSYERPSMSVEDEKERLVRGFYSAASSPVPAYDQRMQVP